MTSHYFGPLGSMVPLSVSVGATVESARGSSEFISSGGVRYVQQGRVAPRTWLISRSWQTSEWVRMLEMAAHGLLGTCWLYDVAAAKANMVPAKYSAGDEPPVLVDGLKLGAVAPGTYFELPVLAGRLYSLSAWRETDGQMLTYRLSGQAPQVLSSALGNGGKSFVPEVDSVLTITVPGAGVSGIRVVDGNWDGTYRSSSGTPCKVAVQDPSVALQLVTEQTRADYSVTLLEVGSPGRT